MLLQLSPKELGQWAAMWYLSPWGEERADLRSGVVAAILANAYRDVKKRSKPFAPGDFMMYNQRDQAEAQQDLAQRLRAALPRAKRKKA